MLVTLAMDAVELGAPEQRWAMPTHRTASLTTSARILIMQAAEPGMS